MRWRQFIASALAVPVLCCVTMAEPSQKRAAEAPAIYLIHGIDDTGRIFRRMSRCLERAGYRPVIVEYKPNDGRGGIEAAAAQVSAALPSRPEAGSGGAYGIIGFSMGGLIARAIFSENAPALLRPRILMTISSPHRGTWMAWTRWNRGGEQMRPGSPLLNKLEEALPRLEGIRLCTIRTPLDLVILPSKSSELPGAENIKIPALLHPLMACDRRVIRRVIRMLDSSFFEEVEKGGILPVAAGAHLQ